MFSQSFEFNLGKRRLKKGTFTGAFLSVSIIAFILYYFISLLQLYLNNQIDPKFRTQSFVSQTLNNVQLKQDLIAFQLFQDTKSLDHIQKQQNQTYVVFMAEFYDFGKVYLLDVIDCENPLLSGYKCIDYSNLPTNSTLYFDQTYGSSSLIRIAAYKCQDTDSRKTFVPANCAKPKDVDNLINNLNNIIQVKLSVSQYNITSNKIEQQFKSQHILMSTSQIFFTEFKAQQQITVVKQGLLIQQESQFRSPVSYVMNSVSYPSDYIQNTMKSKFFARLFLDLDETIFQTQIQYPTFTEILAQCNSALALLMCFGFIGRRLALGVIRQELFLATLQNYFQGTFKKILKKNNFLEFENFNLNESKEKYSKSNIDEEDILDSVNIPSFATKSGENILKFRQFDTIKEDVVINIDSQIQNNNKFIMQTQEYQKKNESLKIMLNQKKNESCKQVEEQVKQDEKYNIKEKLRLLKGNPDKQKPQIQKPSTNFLIISQNNNQIKTNTLQKSMSSESFQKKSFKCLNQIDKMLSSLNNRELNKKIQNILFKFNCI
ncbi:hypothetical protein ABPG74_001755 [Tetrahymena malaccensis]